MKPKNYLLHILFCVVTVHIAIGQTNITGRVLGAQQWGGYFGLNYGLSNKGSYKTTTAKNDIPYPTTWKYIIGGKYRLFNFGKQDYMFMPSNNGVGTYMLYINYNNHSKDLMEMNYMADSIVCQQISKKVIIFKLINNEFKQKDDTLNLGRYLITDMDGKLASKAVVTHDCNLFFNSIDTAHTTIYFNVQFGRGVTCIKCLGFNYSGGFLLSSFYNLASIKNNVTVDDVHSVALTRIENAK